MEKKTDGFTTFERSHVIRNFANAYRMKKLQVQEIVHKNGYFEGIWWKKHLRNIANKQCTKFFKPQPIGKKYG